MNNQRLTSYLTKLRKPSSGWQRKLEELAERDHVPIMEREGIDLLKQLLRLKHPERILEIGTAIGYSALQMSEAVPGASIVTIERDTTMIEQANQHFKQYDQEKKITLIPGEAFDSFEAVEEKGPYDVIFIDAAKGQYKRFFEKFSPLLMEQGIIITDNILFHGYVVDSSLAVKRLRKLAEKIDHYNHWLSNHSDYLTEFIPMGDGIAVSIKK